MDGSLYAYEDDSEDDPDNTERWLGLHKLLPTMPNLINLEISSSCSSFVLTQDCSLLQHLTALQSLDILVQTQPAERAWPLEALEPLTHLPSLKALHLFIEDMEDVPLLLHPQFSRLTLLSDLRLGRHAIYDVHIAAAYHAYDNPNMAAAVAPLTGLVHLSLRQVVDVPPAQLSRLVMLTFLELEFFMTPFPVMALQKALEQNTANLEEIRLEGCYDW